VKGALRYCLIGRRQRAPCVNCKGPCVSLYWLAVVALGLAGGALARFLVVRFAPTAEGSGVQRVEAAFSGEVKLVPHSILPVKFFGGLIAIGSGLALGRERPTVQMGASLSRLASRLLIKDDQDMRVIAAAGAGAGDEPRSRQCRPACAEKRVQTRSGSLFRHC
jgi:H+/Cl- antiporter ClcA